MEKSNQDLLISKLALNCAQERLMYSLQYLITKNDCMNEKNEKVADSKGEWLNQWEDIINGVLESKEKGLKVIKAERELLVEIEKEFNTSPNKMWYHLCVLEATLFVPYFTLKNDKEENKKLNKNRYRKNKYLFNLIKEQGLIEAEFVKIVIKSYKENLQKIQGVAKNILIATLGIAAIAAIVASIFLGPIALAIAGDATLKGAAAVSAALATIGGGAIAAGGLGMAGGTAIVVGGSGLLFGITAGGITTMGQLYFSTPKFMLTQAAKLEIVLKEIVLNSQQDTLFAQEMIEELKKQIRSLEDQIEVQQKIENDKSKHLKNLEKSLNILNKAYIKMKSDYDKVISNNNDMTKE